MDALALLAEARADGVLITCVDGELQIEAKKSQSHWLAKIKPHKAGIITHLSGGDMSLVTDYPIETRQITLQSVTSDSDERKITLAWKPFPLAAMPITLRSFAREWAASIPCDPAAIVLPMLSVVASAIGMSRRLSISTTWREPCIVWTALVADSGSVKSAIMEASVGHLDSRERKFAAQHKQAMIDHENRKAEHERDMGSYRRGKTDVLPMKPEEPARIHARLDDVTLESLANVFRDNPRGTFVARDELAAWFGGFDKYSSGGGDAPAWLSLFGGRSFSVRRKTGNQSIYIPAAGLSLTGTIQPDRMRALATAEHRSSGMIARFLVAMPPRLPKRLIASSLRNETRDAFDQLLDRLFSLRMTNGKLSNNPAEGDFSEWNNSEGNLKDVFVDQQTDVQPEPVDIELMPDAWNRFSEFVESHDEHTRSESGDLQASFAKLEGYVPRLALMFHLSAWAESELPDDHAPVTLDCTERAITIIEWFRHEQERVYSLLGFSNVGPSESKLIELIRRHDGKMSANELRRNCRKYRDDSDGAEIALRALVDSGKGEWETISPSVLGGTAKRIFRLA